MLIKVKASIPDILVGVFLTVAVFAMGTVFESSVPPPSQQIEKADHPQAANEGAERTAEKQIAYYTKWLAWFTGALVAISGFQGYFLLRADKTARIVANAADKSAKAVVAVEMPTLAPSLIALHREPGVNGKVEGYPGPVSTFSINFKNFGRTAAELVAQCIEWAVVDRLPEAPVYKLSFPFVPGTFVEHGKNLPATIQNFIITLLPEEVEAISKETKFLWVYGYISFKDFLGNGHEQRWCARWQAFGPRPDGSRGPMGFVYDSSTPPEYTKRT